MRLTSRSDAKTKIPVSSLIDVVFLLLVYFMVTAALIRKEADLGFQLPSIDGEEPLKIPVEVIVDITADGTVEVEGMRFANNDTSLDGLVKQLKGLKRVADAQQSKCYININPDKDTLHRRVVDVMDACVEAGVKHLGFGESI